MDIPKMGNRKNLSILQINGDLANLWFSIACMFNAISEYDYTRIEESYREEAKERTNLMAYGVLVIYQFAFFEDSIPWETWKFYDDEKVKRLIAYRHIRHAYAHSFNGKRVYRSKIEAEKFDSIMASIKPLDGVKVDSGDCINLTLDSISELNCLLRSVASIHISRTIMPQTY